MQDYADWKNATEKVTNLHLDPLNPRIPNPSASRSQPELIAYLVENDNVYSLARDIVTIGYLPTEIPVVVRENLGSGSRLYVLCRRPPGSGGIGRELAGLAPASRAGPARHQAP